MGTPNKKPIVNTTIANTINLYLNKKVRQKDIVLLFITNYNKGHSISLDMFRAKYSLFNIKTDILTMQVFPSQNQVFPDSSEQFACLYHY